MSGRFEKGRSGNPAGRPRTRRPNVSAFDIIIDRTLTVTQDGVERELSVDEALQLQTYQAALKGSKMAIRAILKMIEKREAALAKSAPPRRQPVDWKWEHDPRNADEAMVILGIAVPDPSWTGGECKDDPRLKLATWVAQAGLSRPGRKKLEAKDVEEIKRVALEPNKLKWPRSCAS